MVATSSPSSSDFYTGFVPLTSATQVQERAAIERDLGDRYHVQKYIARGGFATVWAAEDLVNRQRVAIKRLEPRANQSRSFFRELRAMFLLTDTHIVRIINFLETAGTHYLIMELCEGGSLRSALSLARRSQQLCPHDRLTAIVQQLALGLDIAHQRNLTHRDLKPENVLFAGDSPKPFRGTAPVKLADFGLANIYMPNDSSQLFGLTGSPAYMAPEQFSGQYSPASDIYALGVIAHELLTGDLPFTGSAEELAYQHLRVTPNIAEQSDLPWIGMIRSMLSKQPNDRPTSTDIIRELSLLPTTKYRTTSQYKDRITCHRIPARLTSIVASRDNAGSRFFVTTGDGFYVWNSGEPEPSYVNCLGLSELHCDPTGAVWCRADRTVYQYRNNRLADAGKIPVGWQSFSLFNSAAHTPRIFGIAENRVMLYDLSTDQTVWQQPIITQGFRTFVAQLPNGGYCCTDFDSEPGIQFFDTFGNPNGHIRLPGICSQLGTWPTVKGLYARLLCGDGFHAFRITRDGCKKLSKSHNVMSLTLGPHKTVLGRWSNGQLMTWTPNRRHHELSVSSTKYGDFQGHAAVTHRLAQLWVGQAESLIEFIDF